MYVIKDRETNELCTADYFPIKCPRCRRSVCAHEDLTCATLTVSGKELQLMYHERCLDEDDRTVLEEAGFDLVDEDGERMVG